jgi:uncharacterized protein (TIGR00299 family) protein
VSDQGVVWLGCASGVAGDMVLGALLDAGADLDEVRTTLSCLELEGWSLELERTSRGGLEATRAIVQVVDDARARPFAAIRELLERATLPERVRDRSLEVFSALAEAEAVRHGVPIDDVHFHEVGGHDAIIDIVGTAAALEVLGVDRVTCSPVGLGHGTVRSAHGTIPAPAPATISLLEGFTVSGLDVASETATPTGAALLRALAKTSSPIPAMEISAQGLGAGSRDLEGIANVVVAIVGTLDDARSEQVAWLATNLDDVTGEVLAHAVEVLLREGGLDVWTQAITMKKGRPAHALNVLCRPEQVKELQGRISSLTGSLGVRSTLLERRVLARSTSTVEVLGHQVRLKVSEVSSKPEFDDVVAVSTATGRSVAEVDALARAALLG